MTVIEGIAFIQQGNPKAAPPSRDQMTAGQKAELTLSAKSGPSITSPKAAVGTLTACHCYIFELSRFSRRFSTSENGLVFVGSHSS
jgi:hypothetical protein